MIIGRDLIRSLGIDIHGSDITIHWDDAAIPWRDIYSTPGERETESRRFKAYTIQMKAII